LHLVEIMIYAQIKNWYRFVSIHYRNVRRLWTS